MLSCFACSEVSAFFFFFLSVFRAGRALKAYGEPGGYFGEREQPFKVVVRAKKRGKIMDEGGRPGDTRRMKSVENLRRDHKREDGYVLFDFSQAHAQCCLLFALQPRHG